MSGVRLCGCTWSESNPDCYQVEEVAALRLYTLPFFRYINKPLRDQLRDQETKPHSLPVTASLIVSGLKKLRVVGAESDAAVQSRVFWRGMRNLQVIVLFLGPYVEEF